MHTKDLAEAMLDGTLDYVPEDDAYTVAADYIKLIQLCERQWSVMVGFDCEYHDQDIREELIKLGAQI